MLSRPITSDFNARRLLHRRSIKSLLTPEQMNVAIERESARADRGGGQFALVLFRVRKRMSLETWRLTRTLLKRIRATDDIGWYDGEHLAVLLPDTSATGAWRFSDDLCAKAGQKNTRPLCSVYSYPTRWFTDDEAPIGGIPRPADNDRHNDDHDQDNNGHGGGGGRYAVRNLVPYFLQGVKDELEQPPSAVHRLENLLVRPLPWWKRALDVTGAAFGLICLSPVMAAAALAIRFDSKGPVIFKQNRAGMGGRPFKIWKFRTMIPDAEAKKAQLKAVNEQDGPAFKIKDDPRITRIGKFLRKTSIDELPQLWNVLIGDMTLVGPRPLPVNESDACEGWQRRRLDVTPGLTCIWQVRGRSRVSFAEWVRMDVSYIRRRTLWHDISILFQTLPAVMLRRGAR